MTVVRLTDWIEARAVAEMATMIEGSGGSANIWAEVRFANVDHAIASGKQLGRHVTQAEAEAEADRIEKAIIAHPFLDGHFSIAIESDVTTLSGSLSPAMAA